MTELTDNETNYTKPILRGRIHAAALVYILISSLLFIVTSLYCSFNFGILIFLLSQFLCYGCSSIYHIPSWSPPIKRIFRFLDHICIFILISGTQTSVLLNSLAKTSFLTPIFIKLSWTISLIGIIRILVTKQLDSIFHLIIYVLHGALVIPFYRIMNILDSLDKFFIFLGGFFYFLGSIVYGTEKPKLNPRIFGYHELFHVLTVIANSCFTVVIYKDYIHSLIKKIKYQL